MLKFFSTWLSAELTWFLSQKVPAAPLVRLWCVAVSFQSWITCWVRQLENKLPPTAEETFLIQKSDLNPPKPWISTVRVLKVHQIFTKISHSHSCFLHNSCGDRTRFVNSLTRINHLSVKRREKGKANYFGTNFKPMDICASFCPSLCSFYHLISNRTNNNMNKCYVLRAGDTHTCNSQREEVFWGASNLSLERLTCMRVNDQTRHGPWKEAPGTPPHQQTCHLWLPAFQCWNLSLKIFSWLLFHFAHTDVRVEDPCGGTPLCSPVASLRVFYCQRTLLTGRHHILHTLCLLLHASLKSSSHSWSASCAFYLWIPSVLDWFH